MVTTQPKPLPTPVHTQQRFASSPTSARAAREFVREVVNDTAPDLTLDQVSDLQLVVSELVTNAVRYGTEPGDALLVGITVRPGVVRVEVHDPTRRRPRRRPWSARRARGRGMFVVEALAMAWGVSERPLGKIVWAVITW